MAILEQDVEEYLASLTSERGLSRHTVAAYRRDLAQYLAFLEGRTTNAARVSGFVKSLHDRGLAASSVARKTAAVRGLHRFRVTEGLAEDDPTVLMETAKRSQPLPKALTLDEVMALLDTPDTATPAGRRDRAILEFLYATGARVSEVVGLDQEDIDLEAGTAIVTGKGNKQRLVPLGGFAVRAIEAYLPDRLGIRLSGRDPGALFLNARGGRLTRQGLWGIVRKQAARAGIPADRVSPHVLRHSAATHMVERGADLRSVQQLLGHATITTTQVYTRVTPQHLFEVYVTSHPRSR
ncbi:MAG: site-specific tyrosine recombinase XerD [Acidimicrobiia bacterium]|nr:site-specific tyrosine recombinase XerD [Acidimicrobiia bacterium]MBT8246777.1 site-specific tyrosine recombinase XerD [Acidimicrobiia bacterium]NNL14626.1 site-specific tyrosine recombinase XerD [Acidimicrobiia bacterium]NNL97582.1 site-specific tyrosine recombinase XerD [Acidimicrobiia bacterium]RZV47884.1 MAG: site-specific tyrosine recombinase XerD [Acidimicrobiia bacterium]